MEDITCEAAAEGSGPILGLMIGLPLSLGVWLLAGIAAVAALH